MQADKLQARLEALGGVEEVGAIKVSTVEPFFEVDGAAPDKIGGIQFDEANELVYLVLAGGVIRSYEFSEIVSIESKAFARGFKIGEKYNPWDVSEGLFNQTPNRKHGF